MRPLNKISLLALLAIGTFVLLGCGSKLPEPLQRPKEVRVIKDHKFEVNGSVRKMVLERDAGEFPAGEGRGEFMSYCAMCHSLEHIMNQPDFTKEVWTYEVHKMVESYGAPIDTATSKKIVEYIMNIKGAR